MVQSLSWWQKGVFYQVYPRSFYDSNDDGIGDLNGIRQKLDYLQWLGIDAIWLSPIFSSPMVDFGYDISNYRAIDPVFGTMDEFDALLSEVHKRGMKLLLDFVPNHTSDQHPWFLEARSSRTNPKRDWYHWHDPAPNGGPPNNWESYTGDSAWLYDQQTQQYYLHIFSDKQPDLNWHNPEVRAAMYDVMRFWLDKGIDGFRVDALWMLVKDPQLRDNPPNPSWPKDGLPGERQSRKWMQDQPGVHEIAREMRSVVNEYPDRVLIGEVHLPLELFLRYYGGEALDEIQLPFNFQLITALWHAQEIRQIVDTFEASLPNGAWPDWALGCHDYVRIVSRVGRAQTCLAHMVLLTLRGTPICYYGDEIEMRDGTVPPRRVRDPEALYAPRFDRGEYRTPMQWNNERNAGFSPRSPWLHVTKDVADANVEEQTHTPTSLLNLVRRLIQQRRTFPALTQGSYRSVNTTSHDVFAYLRETADQRILVALNFGSQPQHLDLSSIGKQGKTLCSTMLDGEGEVDLSHLTLRPDEGLMILV